ncbi:MAG: hypothetical protein N4A49_01805 [Marinifilaceae bacterium]|jgi:predicted aspartyl protease|nr:hypothetical protein [Marinifilaceae bacterium]
MKLSEEIKKKAQDLMQSNNWTEIFTNDKGEFFSSINLALISVDNKKSRVKCIVAEPESLEQLIACKQQELLDAEMKLKEANEQNVDNLEESELEKHFDLIKDLDKEVSRIENEIEELKNKE